MRGKGYGVASLGEGLLFCGNVIVNYISRSYVGKE